MKAILPSYLKADASHVDLDTVGRLVPVQISVPERELEDLRFRLARTRWAEELPGAEWAYGVPVSRVQHLVDAWLNRYDWRACETQFNNHPQYLTTIDGQLLHVMHMRSGRQDALPLLLLHGWPGSVAEFLPLASRLTAPPDLRRETPLVFDLVIPSLPGFGFSGPTRERGWNVSRIARACTVLMERLGYTRYGVFGTDWGSFIAPGVGRAAPGSVVGSHVAQLFSGPIGQPGELDHLPPEDAAALTANRHWVEDVGGAYAVVQAQQPQTLAHALADSPAGLLGWFSQIFRDGVDEAFVLTHASIHWLTGTVASAMRIYREHALSPRPLEPTRVPLALSQFRDDHRVVRRFAERDHANIVAWTVHASGGHYAAHQQPDQLAEDLRAFFEPRAAAPASVP